MTMTYTIYVRYAFALCALFCGVRSQRNISQLYVVLFRLFCEFACCSFSNKNISQTTEAQVLFSVENYHTFRYLHINSTLLWKSYKFCMIILRFFRLLGWQINWKRLPQVGSTCMNTNCKSYRAVNDLTCEADPQTY